MLRTKWCQKFEAIRETRSHDHKTHSCKNKKKKIVWDFLNQDLHGRDGPFPYAGRRTDNEKKNEKKCTQIATINCQLKT